MARRTLHDAWLSDVGIRVTNLEHSMRFYRRLLDLEKLVHRSDEWSAFVRFRDRRSGQRLELNWYAKKSPFAGPYTVGEGLDHLEVRVRDVEATLKRLARFGIRPVNRKLWVNKAAVRKLRSDPEWGRYMDKDVWETGKGHRVAYIQDPDGLFIALYDHPEERWSGPIPDHY